jgi:hypothetical protein
MTFTAVQYWGKAAYQSLIALAIFLEGFLQFLKKLEDQLFYIEPGPQVLCYGVFQLLRPRIVVILFLLWWIANCASISGSRIFTVTRDVVRNPVTLESQLVHSYRSLKPCILVK